MTLIPKELASGIVHSSVGDYCATSETGNVQSVHASAIELPPRKRGALVTWICCNLFQDALTWENTKKISNVTEI